MSDISGSGYGSSHNWEHKETLQWGAAGLHSSCANTLYKCRDCGQVFQHNYHEISDIFEAMQTLGISEICSINKLKGK
ncbi:MAG: hypothetical protein ACUZ9M_00705 [Candidatus Scalindua sp.]